MALPKNPLETFTWGAGGAALTPEELAKRRELEAALLAKEGPDFSPVGHWTQGLARVAHAAAGAYRRNNLDKAQAENDTYNSSLIARLLGGGEASSSSMPASTDMGGEVAATAPGATGDMQAYRDAIASIESAGSGDYQAIGPTNSKLGRALGRYQIMEANLGPWGREALGRDVTADEFLANPQLQDAIFDHRFGQYVNQYGPEGAAQAWFAGPGGVGKAGRKDVLGTTVGGYSKKFLNALGNSQVAAATPEAAFEAVTSPAGASLADEVAEFEQTPEYAAQLGSATGQPMADEQFDDRFGQTALPAETNQSRAELAAALAASNQPAAGQQAIADQTRAIPEQFAGSQQMADASGGIVPALMEGQPATEQQVAQAMALGNQQQPAGRTGIDPQLLQALADPRLNQQGRQVLEFLVKQQAGEMDAARQQQAQRDSWLWQKQQEQQMQAEDPLRKLQLQKGQLEIDALQNPQPGYRTLTTDEALSLGLDPKKVYQQARDGKITDVGGSLVNVNVGGNNSKFVEESDKAAATRLGTIVEEGAKAGGILADMQQLADLGTQIQTGRGAEALVTFGPFLQAIGVDVEGLEPAQAYRSIIDRLAPQMRPAGSGATSDFDARQFLSSLPALGNSVGANEIINQTFQSIAQNKMEAAAIARRAQRGEIQWQDAEDQISKLPNPYQRFKEWEKERKASESKAPEGMDPADWEFLTPEERRLFQ